MENININGNLENSDYINLLLEEIKKTASPLRRCHNYFCLALAYLQIQDHPQALNALCEAYIIYNEAKLPEKNPLYGEIILVSINQLIYFEKFQESLDFINELLNISPDLPDALFCRGICQEALGETPAAIVTYQYTLQLLNNTGSPKQMPKNLNPLGIMSCSETLVPDLLTKLSFCYLQQGNKPEALSWLKKLEALNLLTGDKLTYLNDKIGEIETGN